MLVILATPKARNGGSQIQGSLSNIKNPYLEKKFTGRKERKLKGGKKRKKYQKKVIINSRTSKLLNLKKNGNSHATLFLKVTRDLEQWLRDEEHELLLQRTIFQQPQCCSQPL